MRTAKFFAVCFCMCLSVTSSSMDNADMYGCWQSVDDPESMFRVMENDFLLYFSDMQVHWFCEVKEGTIIRSDVWGWKGASEYTLENDLLTVDLDTIKGTFRRMESTPWQLQFEPLELGEEALTETERKDIADEVIARMNEEQEIRRELGRISQAIPRGEATAEMRQEVMNRMMEIDHSNRRWLIDTITRVGWINAGRFGKEAAVGAFLIVQHSQYLPLLRVALPFISSDVDNGLIAANNYALLLDRTLLSMNRPQKFATQFFKKEGDWYVAPLETWDNLNERRAAMGLKPIEESIEALSQRIGDEVRTDWESLYMKKSSSKDQPMKGAAGSNSVVASIADRQ